MLENKYSTFQSTNSDSTRTANSSPNPYEKTLEKRIAIFDWDDTLFCTKYLETFQLNFTDIFSFKYSLEETNPYLLNQLKDLENSIIQLFYEIVECKFEIFIVSNADFRLLIFSHKMCSLRSTRFWIESDSKKPTSVGCFKL